MSPTEAWNAGDFELAGKLRHEQVIQDAIRAEIEAQSRRSKETPERRSVWGETAMKADLRKQRGHAVLAARESRGWSLEECSASSGFSVRQIMAWERGVHGLTLESLGRLARGYGMKHDEVITIVMGGPDEVGSRSGQVR